MLFDVYEQLARRSPDRTALSFHRPPHDGTVMTWRDLVDRSAEIAEDLAAAGVARGGRCAVVMADHPDLLPTVLAVWRAEAVVVPIDGHWGTDTLRSVLALSDAGFVVDAEQGTCVENPDARGDGPALSPDTAMISYTSGSTSDPKGVVLTHGQLRHAYEAGGRALRELLGYSPSRFGVSMRMSGLGILGMNYLWPAVMGIPVAVLPELTLMSANRYWSDLRAHGVEATYLVPALVELLNRAAPDETTEEGRETGTVACLSGGAPLSPTALGLFQDRFRAVLLNVYGMTEVSFAAFFGDLDVNGRGTLSIGRPATVDARLRGIEGLVHGAGEGELELRGPAMSCGYYDNPSATEELLHDGWVRSGDLARRDSEGRYWISGRRKDVVLKGGFTVYLHEVEEVAGLMPGVLESAAVRLDLPTGEDIGLIVRSDPAAQLIPGDLQRALAEKLGRQRAPRRVAVTSEALPRLGQEKINRREALALWHRLVADRSSGAHQP
ncbi:class I adenylate-forming enzyme family protein [Nocardiopsis xinjiangensis]|uniref:class I adenylate-forming enzyme family protein n=1 Tax=Nocardiopsis xinjiangensis TaxID=124285 RepID=UPI00034AB286|nr:class I adenylate-forming enzyme family protein [Nocardiopsis xinjiangensis]